MDNYARALENARKLFLNWDQQKLILRCGLHFDDDYLYLNFLGDPWRIQRVNGVAQCMADGIINANFSQALSIYDYLCRSQALPALAGRFCPVSSLPHVAQSSPNAASMQQPYADFFQQYIPALKQALNQLGLSPYPKGDAACLFPVFNGFNAVFQFWEADEDFPPSVCFLWDENAQGYLKFETLYYVMNCFLEKLRAQITKIEKIQDK